MVFFDDRRKACLHRMGVGAAMGAGVGGAAGLLFGAAESRRYTIPTSQKVGMVLRNSVAGAAVFGFFLAVGTGIRSCGSSQ